MMNYMSRHQQIHQHDLVWKLKWTIEWMMAEMKLENIKHSCITYIQFIIWWSYELESLICEILLITKRNALKQRSCSFNLHNFFMKFKHQLSTNLWSCRSSENSFLLLPIQRKFISVVADPAKIHFWKCRSSKNSIMAESKVSVKNKWKITRIYT
jgi:hypothetical protein